jgi:hypothetical protein
LRAALAGTAAARAASTARLRLPALRPLDFLDLVGLNITAPIYD